MNKPISTQVHGILDYMSVGTLLALPRLFGWSKPVTNLLSRAALGTLVYSLLTRYELGLFKVLPMKGHLGLDASSGALLCAAPFLFLNEKGNVKASLVGLGLFEIAASLLTRTERSTTFTAAEISEAVHETPHVTVRG